MTVFVNINHNNVVASNKYYCHNLLHISYHLVGI